MIDHCRSFLSYIIGPINWTLYTCDNRLRAFKIVPENRFPLELVDFPFVRWPQIPPILRTILIAVVHWSYAIITARGFDDRESNKVSWFCKTYGSALTRMLVNFDVTRCVPMYVSCTWLCTNGNESRTSEAKKVAIDLGEYTTWYPCLALYYPVNLSFLAWSRMIDSNRLKMIDSCGDRWRRGRLMAINRPVDSIINRSSITAIGHSVKPFSFQWFYKSINGPFSDLIEINFQPNRCKKHQKKHLCVGD